LSVGPCLWALPNRGLRCEENDPGPGRRADELAVLTGPGASPGPAGTPLLVSGTAGGPDSPHVSAARRMGGGVVGSRPRLVRRVVARPALSVHRRGDVLRPLGVRGGRGGRKRSGLGGRRGRAGHPPATKRTRLARPGPRAGHRLGVWPAVLRLPG